MTPARRPRARSPARLAAGLALACALVARPAGAEVFLEAMTTVEVRDALRGGRTTVIVPVGGTEQNGPHMTLGKHNARVRALAGRVAERLGDALVAPVLAYVPEGGIAPPTGHMRFPGTISIPESAFAQVLDGAIASLAAHGFRDIVLVGDSGDYQRALVAAAQRFDARARAAGPRAHAVTAYYEAASRGFPSALRALGFADAEIGTHAGLADTALALAVDPALVRPAAVAAFAPPVAGVAGDPRRATAALGALGTDAIVEATVDAIRSARERR